MSYENHMHSERDVTSSLIDFSDGSKHTDRSTFKTTLECDWTEAVTGWRNVVPSPQYVPHSVSNVIKKRKPDKMPDWQRTCNSDQISDWLGDGSKAGVRCVGDDFDNFPIPPWKANVEQGTYRYVPNNGYYRTIKFLTFDERREWFTVTKKQPEKVSMSWQNKRFQKELKRQLKREFSTLHHHRQRQSPSMSMYDSKSVESKSENHTARTTESLKSNRVRSTQSQASNSSVNTEVKRKVSESPIRSAPVNGQLMKSASDLYIENFTHRITALEEELKRDSRIVRKTHEEPSKTNGKSKVSAMKDLSQKLREKETTPRPVPHSTKEIITQDSFTIKPVGNRELKPIEKNTTSGQKPSGDGDKFGVTQLKYTNSSNGSTVLNIPNFQNQGNIANGELDKTLHSYKLAIETTKQSLIHTLSASKIQRRSSSKGLSSPASVVSYDNGPSSENVPEKVGKNGHPRSQNISSHKETIKNPDKKSPLAGILPEISGKRLEVPPTAHKWL